MALTIPGITNYVGGIARQLGNFMLATGVLTTGVAAVFYRRGEKWAWYVAWMLPIIVVVQLVNGLTSAAFLWELDVAFTAIALVGLLLPYRKFFPKQQHV